MIVKLKRKLQVGAVVLVTGLALSVGCTSDEAEVEEPVAAEQTAETSPVPEAAPSEDVGLEAPVADAGATGDLAAPADVAAEAAPVAETLPAAVAPELSGNVVYFGYDKAVLGSDAKQSLDSIAEQLKSSQGRYQVEGHADKRGTDEYNLALGNQRAESVKSYLVGKGIGADRLETISYGETKPVAEGESEDAWKQNRRAVVTGLAQ